ncbi:hypothetical protein BVC80_7093g1 [Macleaya cordata]|uniref:Secreted protein n=1 Tax=Macleaya cordata TaxID=56857 RepID=A0A200R8I8_MACCD|nr:hypothetical protein BVC80_7093g1 [Macleaya cordata]
MTLNSSSIIFLLFLQLAITEIEIKSERRSSFQNDPTDEALISRTKSSDLSSIAIAAATTTAADASQAAVAVVRLTCHE